MKYFIDFEFLEGDVPCQIKGFSIPRWLIKPNNTIQPISVGICSSDGREYYAISKEFNLKEAWNRFDIKKDFGKPQNLGDIKVYWIRENVLKPIYDDLERKEVNNYKGFVDPYYELELDFTYKNFKRLINKYGKNNKQIAEEILDFVNTNGSFVHKAYDKKQKNKVFDDVIEDYGKPQFYGYYADYDWVVFCWLFGKMIDLPKGFPMYCIDLKPILDNKVNKLETYQLSNIVFPNGDKGFTNDKDGILSVKLDRIKECPNYPNQTNEHNALDDAKWNYELYKFLQNL